MFQEISSILAFCIASGSAVALAHPPTYTDEEAEQSASQPNIPPIEELAPQKRRPPPFTVGGQPLPPAYPPRQPAKPFVYKPRKPRHFGVHAGVNLGLFAVDLHAGHFYGYLAAGMGVTLLSDMRFGAFTGGAGYSLQLSRGRTSDWFMDMLVMGTGGWQDALRQSGFVRYGYGGVGLGLGFRFEHGSGFSLGFKIPLFGYAFGADVLSSARGVGLYYLASLAALPIVSIGYRF
jgi:hypothetical protein